MGMPWRAECLVGREQGKQGMGRERVRRADEGKHREQLHEKGKYGINAFLTLSHNYTMKENKAKCWVCAHLPHSSQIGLLLAVIPFEEIDYCRAGWYHNYMADNRKGINGTYAKVASNGTNP